MGGLGSLADLGAYVADFGPVLGLVALVLWIHARQSEQLLQGLLGGLETVRQAQAEGAQKTAEAVAELRGIRSSLDRTEIDMRALAERTHEHGETLRAHGQRLADMGRRIDRLEDDTRPRH